MRPGSDGRLWVLAAAVSLGVHGTLAAGLVLMPAPENAGVSETAIDIQGVRSGVSENVATARRLEPAEAERRTAEPVRDSPLGEAAEPDRKTLAAAGVLEEARKAADRRTAAMRATPQAAAAVSSAPAVLTPAEAVRTELQRSGHDRTAAAAPAPPVGARIAEAQTASATIAPATVRRETAIPPAAARRLEAIQMPGATVSPQPNPEVATVTSPPAGTLVTPKAEAAPAARTVDAQVAARVAPAPAAVPSRADPVAPRADAAPREVGRRTPSAQRALQPSTPGDGHEAASRSSASSRAAASVRVPSGNIAPAPVKAPAMISAAVPEARAPSTAAADTVALLAPRVPSRPTPQVEEIDPRERVLDYLSLHEGGGCFLALASADASSPLTVEGFTDVPDEVGRLSDELARIARIPVDVNARTVTRDQCGALSFARRLAGYPVPALDVRLEKRSITSGAFLSGRIENLARRMLYLLLVDDEGKVEEIDNLFHAENAIGFSAPMTLEDGPVETVQILVAIASDEPLATVSVHDGANADVYFHALEDEIADTGNRVDFGFAYFLVR